MQIIHYEEKKLKLRDLFASFYSYFSVLQFSTVLYFLIYIEEKRYVERKFSKL